MKIDIIRYDAHNATEEQRQKKMKTLTFFCSQLSSFTVNAHMFWIFIFPFVQPTRQQSFGDTMKSSKIILVTNCCVLPQFNFERAVGFCSLLNF